MKLILLDDNENKTPNKIDWSLDLTALKYISPLSNYLYCKISDPIVGNIDLAISLNCRAGKAKFVVNSCEIHSLVKFNETEEKSIKNFFQKYT